MEGSNQLHECNNFHSADSADGKLPNRIPTSTCTSPAQLYFSLPQLMYAGKKKHTEIQALLFCGTEEL
jgi:hypothetical protein